jgi:hypothetical protein
METRNEKGQFVVTSGNQRYRNVQFNNKRMGEHAKVFCLATGLDEIPNGFVVHHLDEKTKNNDIHNLSLVTITAHNRIHSHSPWNKGITASTNKKWGLANIKRTESRRTNYLPICQQAFDLQNGGKTLREIATIMGTSRRQVSDRIKTWKLHVKSCVG